MKTMFKCLAFTIIFALWTLNAFASMEAFHSRFKLVRNNEGVLVRIQDRTMVTDISVRMFIQFVLNRLIMEQGLLDAKGGIGDYEESIRDLFEDDMGSTFDDSKGGVKRKVEVIIKSLQGLAAVKLKKIQENPRFQMVMKKYVEKIVEVIGSYNINVVANLDNTRFFYRRNVTSEVLGWGLKLAKKYLKFVPTLKTAIYLIVQIDRHLKARLIYHQNILLYYLENATEEELQMTHDEVNYALSSIYEAKIPWMMKRESDHAINDWYMYGVNKFYAQYRLANKRLRLFGKDFDQINQRLNFAFSEAVYKGERVIINLFDQNSLFSKIPAITFYRDSPSKVLRKRVILQLAQLGIEFIKIPGWIKNSAVTFMKSYYEKQRLTEGVLVGYFEHNDSKVLRNYIKAQSLIAFD